MNPGVILKGCCQCGAIEYEIDAKPLFTSVCHCLECQKLSGGANSVTSFFRAQAFKLLKGELSKFVRKADSGRTVENYFCPGCGNRIYHFSPESPEMIRLKPGTLGDKSLTKPLFHVWASSRVPWDKIPLGAPRFAKQVNDRSAIIRRIVLHKLAYYLLSLSALFISCTGIYHLYVFLKKSL